MKAYRIAHEEAKKDKEVAGEFFGISYCLTIKECKELNCTGIIHVNMWDYANTVYHSYEGYEEDD